MLQGPSRHRDISRTHYPWWHRSCTQTGYSNGKTRTTGRQNRFGTGSAWYRSRSPRVRSSCLRILSAPELCRLEGAEVVVRETNTLPVRWNIITQILLCFKHTHTHSTHLFATKHSHMTHTIFKRLTIINNIHVSIVKQKVKIYCLVVVRTKL